MMHAVDEHDDIRALLQSVDPGETPQFDAEQLMVRGNRSRRVRRLDRWLAVAAAMVLLAGVGFGVAHLSGPQPAPVQSPSPSRPPTPAPTTASEYLAAAQAAIRDARSVRVQAKVGGGAVLDVVVDPHYASGVLTARGVSSRYVADASHVYIEPAALAAMGMLSADDVAKANGRWIAMIGAAPLNQFRTSFWVAASLDENWWPRPTSVQPDNVGNSGTVTLLRTISGTPWELGVSRTAPYRPDLLHVGPPSAPSSTFTDWDAGSTPPAFPAADDVYDPWTSSP